jgi:hypothetical protein
MAGLIATRPGGRIRLFYRLRVYHGRSNEPEGPGEHDCIALLSAVHAQLRAPLIVVWDNLSHHVSATMRQFVDQHDWLTVVQRPAYAPELNPTEDVWSHVKRGLGNLAACSVHRRDRPGPPAATPRDHPTRVACAHVRSGSRGVAA